MHGTSTASAVMAAILANMTMRLGPASVPTEHGFRMTYVVAMLATVVGLLLTLATPRVRRFSAEQDTGTEPAQPRVATGKH
ncbi:hypothetical protein [Streptomyces sp. NBC_00893]|uniref:hypothetical protein n=1 Tax=Streptomyces sp. NBC_00893 TaxID=2975862 RepID=UPI00224D54AD|nr:hypothetical protein [Streptomyces sp. NBC_00893]MCX4850208.1 hypothetical protein [Streptomyces sp. NBC_00893]